MSRRRSRSRFALGVNRSAGLMIGADAALAGTFFYLGDFRMQ
jgi:hypothetical protein